MKVADSLPQAFPRCANLQFQELRQTAPNAFLKANYSICGDFIKGFLKGIFVLNLFCNHARRRCTPRGAIETA